ncbi:MAG: bifunctional phosphopantothenoylcysteine decarboxylase/phosphopantothenate--cysteine ligase CoaBC, partial [Alphaproteobacteria bacterium]
ILTKGGAEFVTPLSLATLSGEKVYTDLFSLTDEAEMGHLSLSQEADLVLVAPATADILAKMAQGLATDLATTSLLATAAPVMVAPAMNTRMWEHAATQANMATLATRGVRVVGPADGLLAEGESGPGRLAEPAEILAAIEDFFGADAPLSGRRALVTSGPTFEPIDPVRYLANRSSGKQGHAIARALAGLGATTVLVSGPTAEPDPDGVELVAVETARQMLDAVMGALPADLAVCAAAVSDWRPAKPSERKIKKNGKTPALALEENPDILAQLSAAGNRRPNLVVGFAAETENLVANARRKLKTKGCDWLLANDVSPATGTFGGDANTIHLIDTDGEEAWPRMSKDEVARRLAKRVAEHFRDRA